MSSPGSAGGVRPRRFMVIETFAQGRVDEVYARFHARGRMLPAGLVCLDSWLQQDGQRCFQLMETADRALFDVWAANWIDLVQFEVIELGERPPPPAED